MARRDFPAKAERLRLRQRRDEIDRLTAQTLGLVSTNLAAINRRNEEIVRTLITIADLAIRIKIEVAAKPAVWDVDLNAALVSSRLPFFIRLESHDFAKRSVLSSDGRILGTASPFDVALLGLKVK